MSDPWLAARLHDIVAWLGGGRRMSKARSSAAAAGFSGRAARWYADAPAVRIITGSQGERVYIVDKKKLNKTTSKVHSKKAPR